MKINSDRQKTQVEMDVYKSENDFSSKHYYE